METTLPQAGTSQQKDRLRYRWTDAAPRATGFYWYSAEFGSDVVLCEVQVVGGALRGQVENDERWYTLGDLAGWWMGPIGRLV